MTVRGTLKADALAIGRISIDFLQNPIKIHALAALVAETQAGQPLGWTEGTGAMFSSETMVKLRELRDSMERDMAKRLFHEGGAASGVSGERGVAIGGLAEHLNNGAHQV